MSESEKPSEEMRTGRASSAIWAGLKYGILAYIVYYIFKWIGWVSCSPRASLALTPQQLFLRQRQWLHPPADHQRVAIHQQQVVCHVHRVTVAPAQAYHAHAHGV